MLENDRRTKNSRAMQQCFQCVGVGGNNNNINSVSKNLNCPIAELCWC